MNTSNRNELVNSYIAAMQWHLDKEKVLRPKDSEWAHEKLMDQDQTDDVMQRLANGPLISLLHFYDDVTLPLLESSAPRNRAVRILLSHVWDDHNLPSATWNHVLALSES